MKKFIAILMLVCLLGSFAACGQQKEATAAVIITPEPVSAQVDEVTEQAQVEVSDVAPMEQTEQVDAENTAANEDQASRPDSGSSTTTNTTTNTNTNTESTGNNDSGTDKLSTAQGYIGSSLSALQGAIGAPNSSEYVVSCMEGASQEGLLYYDGFVVWTIQYNDGSEIVMGIS